MGICCTKPELKQLKPKRYQYINIMYDDANKRTKHTYDYKYKPKYG